MSALRQTDNSGSDVAQILEGLHRGEKVELPHGANAVRVRYENGAVVTVLTADIDCLAGAGVPVRVEFGRIPFDRKGRPVRDEFEALRKRSAILRRQT